MKRKDIDADLGDLCRQIRLRLKEDDEYGVADRLDTWTDTGLLGFLRMQAAEQKREHIRPGMGFLPFAIGIGVAALAWYFW